MSLKSAEAELSLGIIRYSRGEHAGRDHSLYFLNVYIRVDKNHTLPLGA